MRSLLVAALILAALAAPARAEDWWSKDKGYHFAVSATLGAGWYASLALLSPDRPAVRAPAALALALVPGLLKEIYDAGRGGPFSGADMTFNVLGAAVATLVGLGVERLLWRPVRPARFW